MSRNDEVKEKYNFKIVIYDHMGRKVKEEFQTDILSEAITKQEAVEEELATKKLVALIVATNKLNFLQKKLV